VNATQQTLERARKVVARGAGRLPVLFTYEEYELALYALDRLIAQLESKEVYICAECERLYEPRRRDSRYCSAHCRWTARNKRRKPIDTAVLGELE